MPAGDPILAADYAVIKLATKDLITCRVRQSAATALASGTNAVPFDTEDFDPYNIHNPSVNTSRFTPTQPGYYRCEGGVYFATSTFVQATWWRKNGTTSYPSGQREGTAAATNVRGQRAGVSVYLNGSTDYMELCCDPGVASNTSVSVQFTSWAEIWFMGRTTNP
jgi:hypothetical protein